MSGTVIVEGSASQSAGATARGGLLVIHGDASARCGISMKGVDIVVRGSVGHMSAFMAQNGCLVVCGDAGEALGDSIYEAHLYVRGAVAGLGADCVEKEMRDEHVAELRELLDRGRRSTPMRRSSAATARRASSTTSRSTTSGPTDVSSSANGSRVAGGWHPGLRESATFDRNAIAEIQRAAREGMYDIRGFGAKRRVPHFDDLLFLGASISRYPLEGYRERCATDVVDRRPASRASRSSSKIPITIAGMSFGALSGHAKEALGRGATEVGTTHDDRRRRHDRGGARALEHARLPAAAVALRDEPRRPAARRRDRGRRRPGRQARRRRHAARPQDLRPRRRDARPAGGDRPAQRLPAPRLDRPGRPRDQDRGAARDHRLGEADLRQGRRHAHLLRRRARGQGRAPT